MVAMFKAVGDFVVVTGTSMDVPIPAVTAGDYGTMWLYQATSEAPPAVPGWTLALAEPDGAGGVGLLLWQVAAADAAATTVPVTVAAGGSAAKVVTFTDAGTTAPTVTTLQGANTSLVSPPLTVTEPTALVFFAFMYAARTAGAVTTTGAITATATARAWDDALGAYTHSTVTAEVASAAGGTIDRAFTGGSTDTWRWVAIVPAATPTTTAPTIATLGTIRAGVPFSQDLLAAGDPATFTVTAGALPSGLTLSSAGVLAGTAPFDWDPFDLTVSATNAGGSDSQRLQGSILLPGETSRSTGTTGTTPWTRFVGTAGGDGVMLYVPTGADPSTVVSMMHGAGPDETWPDDEPAETRDFAIDQGWAVLGANAGGVSYASPTALDAWDAAHEWFDAVWPIGDVVLYAGSMGSQLALIYAAQGRRSDVLGLVLVDSLMSLQWYWGAAPTEWRNAIKAAYGFSNDGDFATATAGSDPLLLPASTWDGMHMFVSYSNADGTILPGQNSIPLIAGATGADITTHVGTGVHSDPANFAPAQVNPWMVDLFIPAFDAPFAGSGTLVATVEPVFDVAASLSGGGTLTASATVRVDVVAAHAGSGMLAAAVTPAVDLEAGFMGAGALTAAIDTEGVVDVSATFTGAGAFAATLIVVFDVAAALAGAGALSVAVVADGVVPAAFAGAGALTAVAVPVAIVSATFAGAGALTATASREGQLPFPDARTLAVIAPTGVLMVGAPIRTLEWSTT